MCPTIEHDNGLMRYFGAKRTKSAGDPFLDHSMRPSAELNQCRIRAAFAMQGSLLDASLYCREWPKRFTRLRARFRI
jgi:hypothetical protein